MPDDDAGPGRKVAHVVDDDAAVRRSLALLLRSAGFSVQVHESGEAFLKAAESAAPAGGLPFGCVLLDLRMPGMDGIAVQREMAARGLGLPVVVVTAHGDVPLAVQAMRAGASDFIEKPYGGEAIIQAAEAALARGDEDRARAREAAEAAARVAALTAREADVLRGLLAGRQNKVIARDLGISPRTVEIHRANLMDKLGVQSLSEALRTALAAGWAPPGEKRP
ncbi:response regulator FixJ [Craurococcus roseus]|uniref:Response regulator FixJ n=1 Tax=Craurococcus roseus TaxID=77585 RepID=A0ABP3PHT3_9PROT